MKILLLVALAAGGLWGCGGKDEKEVPAELIEFEPSIQIRTVWKHRIGDGTERLRLGLAPATDGTRIVAGAPDGTAAAFGLTDGEALWETDTGLRLAAGPGVGEGLVVFGATDGYLVALDAETGELRWQQPVASEILASPAVADGLVVYRSTDGRLGAVDADDGEEVWVVVQTLPILTLRGNTAPLVIGDTVVAGFDNGRIGAYRLADGVMRWQDEISTPSGRSEIERLVDVGIDLEVFGTTVYAASFQGEAKALLVQTGGPIWDESFSSFAGLGVDSDHVYITTDVSAVIALRRSSGSEVWRQLSLSLRDVTAAARHRETVVVADFEGYVHWLNADDGSFMARVRATSAQITAQPLAVGPLVFVQAEDGTLAAFEIADETD